MADILCQGKYAELMQERPKTGSTLVCSCANINISQDKKISNCTHIYCVDKPKIMELELGFIRFVRRSPSIMQLTR